MIVDGVEYTFVKASDVEMDGVRLECYTGYQSGGTHTLVAEAVWHDLTGRFEISLPQGPLPFVVVDTLIRAAARWCSPSLRNEPGTVTLIYVPLVGEAVEVWRPVLAERVGEGQYRITGENPSPDEEQWAFSPGDIVECKERHFDNGNKSLVAVRVVSDR